MTSHRLKWGLFPPNEVSRISVAAVTSVANDKDDNEMIRGAVHRSPGICLSAEENPGKPHLGDRLKKTSHQLKWGSFSPNDIGRIFQHFRKGEGRKIYFYPR